MSDAEETRSRIRKSMALIRAEVEESYDGHTGTYTYRKCKRGVTVSEVLRRAGVMSRTTLTQPWHADLKTEVASFVKWAREKTGVSGRDNREAATMQRASTVENQLSLMAQKLFAKDLEIERLKAILNDTRSGADKVTVLDKRKK